MLNEWLNRDGVVFTVTIRMAGNEPSVWRCAASRLIVGEVIAACCALFFLSGFFSEAGRRTLDLLTGA